MTLFSSRFALWYEGLPFNKVSMRNTQYLTWFFSACKVHSLIRSVCFSGGIWEVCVCTGCVTACVGTWWDFQVPWWNYVCAPRGSLPGGCMGRTWVLSALSFLGSKHWVSGFCHRGMCLRELM